MDYFENQLLLRSCYDAQAAEVRIPDTGTRFVNCLFESVVRPERYHIGHQTDGQVPESDLLARSFEGNYRFSYPVCMPEGVRRAGGAVILLHGLNERNWFKYLYWARYLSEQTGKAVILFPMAFHINRSPGFWSDPRAMQPVALQRTGLSPDNSLATAVNAALSTRLDSHPEWFCSSGLQTGYDLISLARTVRAGEHPLFRKDSRVDFFAYSVGAFLLEVLLIADLGNLFGDSRSFFFLGGSTFEQMRGISRYIMDARAFDRLEDAYLRQDPKALREAIRVDYHEMFNRLWSAFMAMLRLDRLQGLRERSFHRLHNQIAAAGLAGDQVIPAKSILRTLWGANNRNKIPVSIYDFPYPYTHENPFPMGNELIRPQVDRAFHQVFGQAARFLA